MVRNAQVFCVFAQQARGWPTEKRKELELAVDWDNLRFFLELARAGKLTIAARRLAVDHTTVARRVQALEKALDRQLFIRAKAGYRLSEAGRELLAQAEAIAKMQAAG